MTHYTERACAYWGVFNYLFAVVLVNTLVSVPSFLTPSLYLSHILEKGISCDWQPYCCYQIQTYSSSALISIRSSSRQEGQWEVSEFNSAICLPFVTPKRRALTSLSCSPRFNEDLVITDVVMRDTVAVVMFVLSLNKLCWWNPA